MTITPRKRRITEALKPHLRHGPKAKLVDAVDALLEKAWQAGFQTQRGIERARYQAIRDALADNDVHSAEQIVTAAIRSRSQQQAAE